jgi:heme exporter protein CcmD
MIDWLHNPHANYVFAAYAIAAAALLGFGILSWRWARGQDKKWQELQKKQAG